MFTKIKSWWMIGIISVFTLGARAQVMPEPEILVELPFDPAPFIASVLALAVVVMLLIAGPKISLMFGSRIISKVGRLFG